MSKTIKGYSKLSKEEKIDWLVKNYLNDDRSIKSEIMSYWHEDNAVQNRFDEFSENTLTNFYMPFGVALSFNQRKNILYSDGD